MKNIKGFTLVELIAIIIIIGIIIGIITPSALKLIEKSKTNAFREGLRSIIRSTEIYMEENNLKTLPEDGLFLGDNDLDIDYADGYSGIIKYIDGQVVLQKISNGKYCGNGGKDTLTVSAYSSDCTVTKTLPQCFTMGKTDIEGDTIIGYDLNNTKCSLNNVQIPATVNNVPVKYIADGAFLESKTYTIGMGYYDTTAMGGPGLYETADLLENLSYMGITPIRRMYFTVVPPITKFCVTSSGNESEVPFEYKMASTNEYVFCSISMKHSNLSSYLALGIGITKVDFSNAINLVKIGDSAFATNSITGTLDLSGAVNLTEIASGAFYSNQIEAVKLPSSLVKIGEAAFEDNVIKTITIPATVTTIGEYAFDENDWQSVTIQSNASNIESRFNATWTNIGWPTVMMPEEAGADYNVTLLTTAVNTLNYVKGSYLLTVPTSGTYKIQLWGAAGGGADPGTGGYGGYISANLSLTSGITYKLVIGQGGKYVNDVDASIFPSQGGGGAGYGYGGSGGGATILSINGTETIVAVAGGGGGASDGTSPTDNTVGSGGYLYSILGNLNGTNSTYRSGGTQTAGGQNLGSGSSYGNPGSYLQGGAGFGNYSTCVTAGFSDCNSAGGGGGGYYGGSGGGADSDAGSGGSSYVNITYGSLNSETVPTEVPLKLSLGANSNGESGYALITYIG